MHSIRIGKVWLCQTGDNLSGWRTGLALQSQPRGGLRATWRGRYNRRNAESSLTFTTERTHGTEAAAHAFSVEHLIEIAEAADAAGGDKLRAELSVRGGFSRRVLERAVVVNVDGPRTNGVSSFTTYTIEGGKWV